MQGVKLSVAQHLPAAADQAITAARVAGETGLPPRAVVTALNALLELGHARRLVAGDGTREVAVARWVRSQDAA